MQNLVYYCETKLINMKVLANIQMEVIVTLMLIFFLKSCSGEAVQVKKVQTSFAN